MAKQIKLLEQTDEMLTEISNKRKKENAPIRSKQDVAAEAIAALHRKEMRK